MFELICNVLLFIFLGYSFFTHVLEAKIPKAYTKNPNVLYPDVWPKVIIILLMICIAINVVKIIKKNKGNPDFTFAAFAKNSVNFLKSKMFIGMIVLFVAAMVLETLGFVVTAALLLFVYGLLLGEKNVIRLLIVSVVVALVMHILFSGLLDVTLPRGNIGFLRNFSLFLENLF
ncbi:MAG: tripartite tricarboxylate transporter TctB family protein [Clostridia bacterium]|nr:tripartite tricarboxylate transporter TctB family protein [Clostridia bacterium]